MDPRLIIGYSLLAILFIFFMVCLVAGIEYQSYRLDLCYRAIYSILKDNPGSGEQKSVPSPFMRFAMSKLFKILISVICVTFLLTSMHVLIEYNKTTWTLISLGDDGEPFAIFQNGSCKIRLGVNLSQFEHLSYYEVYEIEHRNGKLISYTGSGGNSPMSTPQGK